VQFTKYKTIRVLVPRDGTSWRYVSGAALMSDARLTGLPAVDASNSAAGYTRERDLYPTS
jgi:hypothetical protein